VRGIPEVQIDAVVDVRVVVVIRLVVFADVIPRNLRIRGFDTPRPGPVVPGARLRRSLTFQRDPLADHHLNQPVRSPGGP
jgi:hypothetical protein